MLTSVLLDYSCRLTPGTSDWAAMGGDLEVLSRLRRPLLPAGPHVRGGATARHAPPSRALLASAYPQSPDWYPTPVHGPPPSRKGVPQRRTTVIALAPVLPVTGCAILLLHYSALHHLWLRKWPTTSSTA